MLYLEILRGTFLGGYIFKSVQILAYFHIIVSTIFHLQKGMRKGPLNPPNHPGCDGTHLVLETQLPLEILRYTYHCKGYNHRQWSCTGRMFFRQLVPFRRAAAECRWQGVLPILQPQPSSIRTASKQQNTLTLTCETLSLQTFVIFFMKTRSQTFTTVEHV